MRVCVCVFACVCNSWQKYKKKTKNKNKYKIQINWLYFGFIVVLCCLREIIINSVSNKKICWFIQLIHVVCFCMCNTLTGRITYGVKTRQNLPVYMHRLIGRTLTCTFYEWMLLHQFQFNWHVQFLLRAEHNMRFTFSCKLPNYQTTIPCLDISKKRVNWMPLKLSKGWWI